MRQPRLLALLLVLAVLLAFGAWRIVHEAPVATLGAESNTPAIDSRNGPEATLEASALPARQEAYAPLSSPTRIHGRVVRGSAQLPVAGIVVSCTQNISYTHVGFTRTGIDVDGTVIYDSPWTPPQAPEFSCTSGADGSFEFKDLDRAAQYTLEAKGSGWLLVNRLTRVAPAEEERLLAVQRVYQAHVIATDENGKPPMNSCDYLRYARIVEQGECESVPVFEPRQQVQRGSVLPPGLELPGEKPDREYTFASDCDAPRLGPFRVLVCCAGFERQDFEFWAYPQGSGADVTVFHLQRAAAATGTLRVSQDCECKEKSCAHLLEGKLVLEPVDPSQKTLEFELTGLVREETFENIPGGTWHARVHARSGGFCFPPAERPPLEIVSGEGESIVHVPVAKLGAIRWKLRGPEDALPRAGVTIHDSEESAPVPLWLSAVMRGVESGPHAFSIDADKVANLEGASSIVTGNSQRITVDVAAGDTKIVVVHTP